MKTKMNRYEGNKYSQKDRTTEEHHDFLKENYKKSGFKSAAAFLESIIDSFKKKK